MSTLSILGFALAGMTVNILELLLLRKKIRIAK
jgi:hypothetical protein